jgi:hypothetical protein
LSVLVGVLGEVPDGGAEDEEMGERVSTDGALVVAVVVALDTLPVDADDVVVAAASLADVMLK